MNRIKLDIVNFCLDEMGRAILTDELLSQIDNFQSAITAGANFRCGGTSNSACSNSSCNGTLNGSCTNSVTCGESTNAIYCQGAAVEPPMNSACA